MTTRPKKRSDAKVRADLRGFALHTIRVQLRFRNDRSHAVIRAQARRQIRESIELLRRYGPGRVVPVTTGGGETTVPETWWGPR